MSLFRAKKQASIVVMGDGFEVIRGNDCIGRVRFDDILSIEAYKRDELTTDRICFDILVAGNPPMTWFTHEEAPGWPELTRALEQLPGFDGAWFEKVSRPPFAECRTVIFERVGRL